MEVQMQKITDRLSGVLTAVIVAAMTIATLAIAGM